MRCFYRLVAGLAALSLVVVAPSGVSASSGPSPAPWPGWVQAAPTVSPPGLAGASMVFDPVSDQVVLFGGTDAGSDPQAGTRVYTGATWVEQRVVAGRRPGWGR